MAAIVFRNSDIDSTGFLVGNAGCPHGRRRYGPGDLPGLVDMAGERGTSGKLTNRDSAGKILVLSSLIILILFLALLKELKRDRPDPLTQAFLFTGEFTNAVYDVLDSLGIPGVELEIETGRISDGNHSWIFQNLDFSVPAGNSLTRLNLALTNAARSFGGDVLNARLEDNGGLLEMQLGLGRYQTHSLHVHKLRELPIVALIIDDFGNNASKVERGFFGIHVPLTFSIMPELPFTQWAADSAVTAGVEVMLHLPMEPVSPDIDPGNDPVRFGMDSQEVSEIIDRGLKEIPNAVGVNNHMGSRAMTDTLVVRTIIEVAKKNNLFMVDSRTSPESVYRKVTSQEGMVPLENECFIDAGKTWREMNSAFESLINTAQAQGYAIGIAHCRRGTLSFLRRTLPRFHKKKVLFVPVSRVYEYLSSKSR